MFTAGDDVDMDAQLLQFGPEDLGTAAIDWALVDRSGRAVRSGRLNPGSLATGHLHDIGHIHFETADLPAPAAYELVLSVAGTSYRNRWSLWVFEAATQSSIPEVVSELTEDVVTRIANGQTIVWEPAPDDLVPNAVLGHTCAFWNTLWTDGQEPHTLGLLNDLSHPIFSHFPSESHSNWHWFDLTFRRRAIDVAGISFKPVVRVVDDWNENRNLVLLAEANVGKGRLLVSAMDLSGNIAERPVARSMRNALASYAEGALVDAPELSVSEVNTWVRRVTV